MHLHAAPKPLFGHILTLASDLREVKGHCCDFFTRFFVACLTASHPFHVSDGLSLKLRIESEHSQSVILPCRKQTQQKATKEINLVAMDIMKTTNAFLQCTNVNKGSCSRNPRLIGIPVCPGLPPRVPRMHSDTCVDLLDTLAVCSIPLYRSLFQEFSPTPTLLIC